LNFLKNVHAISERNKSVILSTLAPGVQAIEDIQIELKVLGEETHHGGASTVLVSFVKSGTMLKKVLYKPRCSETECAILELFKQLNLEPDHPKLPEYKILPMESCSYWEYVEGTHLLSGDAASFLKEFPLTTSERDQAQFNLAYLHSICRSIGISDLHYQNVIFNRDLLQIIPIDMEVIKHGHATGLFGHHQEGPNRQLSVNVLKRIDRFNSDQKNRVFRNTPVATSVLTDVVSNFKVSGNLELVREARRKIMEGLGNALIVSRIMLDNTLEKYLLDDLERGDVPTFSQKGKILYYGTILDDEHKIAVLEPKEGGT